MKLNIGLAATMAGFAAAAQQPAQVYLQSSASTPSSASISANLARVILKQRMLPFGHGPASTDAKGEFLDDIVAALNQWGKKAPTEEKQELDPYQLLVILENLDEQMMKDVAGKIEKNNEGLKPAFEILNPPAGEDGILDMELYNTWIETKAKCSNEDLSDINNSHCWSPLHRTNLVRINMENYGAQKDAQSMLDQINAYKPNPQKLRHDLSIEVMVLAAPRNDNSNDSDLHRRQMSEQVMATAEVEQEQEPATDSETSSAEEKTFLTSVNPNVATLKQLPACFESEDACAQATNNCTGHGQCANKYNSDKNACFACQCLGTKSESGSFTQWAGPACTKKDVSAPFWLFAGFTVVLLGVTTMAIGMLYSVGEEKLPGVIGAGVSGKSAQK